MKQTRIDIIRTAILDEGGDYIDRSGKDYYADGPRSGFGRKIRHNETIYKVPTYKDGLDVDARKRVVDVLRKHPGVKTAYLSRKYRGSTGGHLKVVFDGTAN